MPSPPPVGPTSTGAERDYRAALNSLGDAVHVVERELRIVLHNDTLRSWDQRLGLPTDIVGRTVFEVWSFLGDAVRREYEQVFATGRTVVTTEVSKVAGESVYTETRKIPIFVGERVEQVMTVIRDVSDYHRMARALEYRAEFERLVSKLSTRFVHVAPAGLDAAIDDALGQIGRFAEVDRPAHPPHETHPGG